MQLSKLDYITYLGHPAWLWIEKHAKTILPPIDPATQAIFDTGHEFEQYAEALYGEGDSLTKQLKRSILDLENDLTTEHQSKS